MKILTFIRYHRFIFLGFLLCSCLPAADVTAQSDITFNHWLRDFKHEAKSKGITPSTLDKAFSGVTPKESIIKLDRKQPEGRLSFEQYADNVLNHQRYRDAKKNYEKHATLLNKIGKEYGVQPRFIVALWGMETNFGGYIGNTRTIDALTTLAFDGRRSDYFRRELHNALKIIEQESLDPDDMKGSWAGALGQCQFMPSTFLSYAVDKDKDGKRDVWHTQSDVFASIANYLKGLDWKEDETWGRRVTLPKDFNTDLADIKSTKPLAEWKRLGVMRADGSALPDADIDASLIFVSDDEGAPTYLVYSNYKALLEWNRSRYFATTVGMLADSIIH